MSSKTAGQTGEFWHQISAWLPVLLGIGVIVLESTQDFGSDHTSKPLRWLFQALFGAVSDPKWMLIHHYIRKSGHFFGYGLLGLVWLRAWRMTLPRFRFPVHVLLALSGTALIACADEWHQSFLPNRTASPRDVLLDCCGAIVLQMLLYAAMRVLPGHRVAEAR